MTQLPTDRSEVDSVAEHTSDHNILNAQHNELDGHAADTTAVHGITDTADLATQADVTAAVSALVDAAPGTLDTLNELAAALGDDANFASTVTTALAGKSAISHNHDASYEATGAVATHTGDTSAAHAASAVAFTPTGTVAATDVQAAIAEVDSEKATTGHTHTGTYVDLGVIDAKGELLVGTADNTVDNLAVSTDGYILTLDSAQTLGLKWAAASGGGNAIYGDGNDGVINFDGSTTVLGLAPSSGVYTLTRDIFLAGGSQVSGTAVVKGGNYRIYCNGTFTIGASASVQCNGVTATNNNGTAAVAVGVYAASGAGQNGTTTAGNAASAVSTSLGGSGGNGGASGANAAGAGAAATAPTGTQGGVPRFAPVPVSILGSNTRLAGGGGGGGAAGDGTNAGGGGGSGGGILILSAKSIVNSGTISANGGNGATRASGNVGGGGGGGGGAVYLIYNTFSGNAATAAGGTKGNGVGTGSNGTDGSAGVVVTLVNA